MIRFLVRELAKKKGITTAYQLQVAMGIPTAKAYRIWGADSNVTIHKPTLDALCEFFDCQPGDLIVRTRKK
jgi:DNA-binding Xre family transcriptional regulator